MLFQRTRRLGFVGRDQIRVLDPAGYHEIEHHEREEILRLSIVEAECELIQVAPQVLHADFVERAYQPRLKRLQKFSMLFVWIDRGSPLRTYSRLMWFTVSWLYCLAEYRVCRVLVRDEELRFF